MNKKKCPTGTLSNLIDERCTLQPVSNEMTLNNLCQLIYCCMKKIEADVLVDQDRKKYFKISRLMTKHSFSTSFDYHGVVSKFLFTRSYS